MSRRLRRSSSRIEDLSPSEKEELSRVVQESRDAHFSPEPAAHSATHQAPTKQPTMQLPNSVSFTGQNLDSFNFFSRLVQESLQHQRKQDQASTSRSQTRQQCFQTRHVSEPITMEEKKNANEQLAQMTENTERLLDHLIREAREQRVDADDHGISELIAEFSALTGRTVEEIVEKYSKDEQGEKAPEEEEGRETGESAAPHVGSRATAPTCAVTTPLETIEEDDNPEDDDKVPQPPSLPLRPSNPFEEFSFPFPMRSGDTHETSRPAGQSIFDPSGSSYRPDLGSEHTPPPPVPRHHHRRGRPTRHFSRPLQDFSFPFAVRSSRRVEEEPTLLEEQEQHQPPVAAAAAPRRVVPTLRHVRSQQEFTNIVRGDDVRADEGRPSPRGENITSLLPPPSPSPFRHPHPPSPSSRRLHQPQGSIVAPRGATTNIQRGQTPTGARIQHRHSERSLRSATSSCSSVRFPFADDGDDEGDDDDNNDKARQPASRIEGVRHPRPESEVASPRPLGGSRDQAGRASHYSRPASRMGFASPYATNAHSSRRYSGGHEDAKDDDDHDDAQRRRGGREDGHKNKEEEYDAENAVVTTAPAFSFRRARLVDVLPSPLPSPSAPSLPLPPPPSRPPPPPPPTPFAPAAAAAAPTTFPARASSLARSNGSPRLSRSSPFPPRAD